MPTILRMNPKPISGRDFKWNSKYVHLTYRGTISSRKILDMVLNATSIKLVAWSRAVEDTSFTDEQGIFHQGYTHTHWAGIWESRLNLTGARKFDIWIEVEDDNGVFTDEIVHPHGQLRLTATQMEQIFTMYHPGRKYDVTTGKYTYHAPIEYDCDMPPEFEFSRCLLDELIAAPSLQEACIVGDIRAKTVNDVKLLRDEAALPDTGFKFLYAANTFKRALAPPAWRTLHVWGASGLGKTKWAVTLFGNPCYIKPFDSIGCLEALFRKYDKTRHDGIVLDEVDLRFMSRSQAIALTEFDEPVTLDVRYKSFELPAGVKKVFISNPSPAELYPADPYGAIRRRIEPLKIDEPTWLAPWLPPPMPGGTPPTQPAAP
jgi:hypothetical protein